jgi:hypothetical protein
MLPNGSVGIVTTNPRALLEIAQSGGGSTLFGYNSLASGGIYSSNYETIGSSGSFNVRTGGGTGLMTILGSGNVGIGTASPASKLNIGTAPVATPNYATLSIGSGAWDGATTGTFVGSASGTSIGVNEVSGYGGNLFDVQVAGVSQAKVSAAGLLTLAGSTFVLGGHTCSIVATVLTCP